MFTKLSWLWDTIQGSLWFVPSVMAAAAVTLAFTAVWIDHDLLQGKPGDTVALVYEGGAHGAREVLSTIAGAMITVAGVIFSITVVALTLASQQFGPRLLRNFMHDRGNQIVLGTFISIHLYCLIVLRAVRGGRCGRVRTTFVGFHCTGLGPNGGRRTNLLLSPRDILNPSIQCNRQDVSRARRGH
jgi:uncharacterized membrane protein